MTVSSVREALQAVVRRLDADVLPADEAARLVDEFTTIEHLAAAGKALAAGRVAASGAWHASGERPEADWLAKRTGDTVGGARAALDVAAKLAGCPATDEALRSGALSLTQAAAVTGAASVAPEAEPGLLRLASGVGVKKLRDECDRVRAAALPDPEARHAAIHRSRAFRAWTSADGARCGQYRMTPDAAAVIESAVAHHAAVAFREARAEGRREPSEAYAADGLVAAVTGGSVAAGGGAVLLVNLETLQRGHLHDGEVCEIAGVGPVPVSVAEELFGSEVLRIVVRDGVDIRTVVHTGRRPTAAQQTALLVRDRGRCVRPRCDRRARQVDHIAPWVPTKVTTLDSLGSLCGPDHLLKTHEGHTYRQGDFGWEWHLPDGSVEHERPPP